MKHYYIYRDYKGFKEYMIDAFPVGEGKFCLQFSGTPRGLFIMKNKTILENLMKASDSIYCRIKEIEL